MIREQFVSISLLFASLIISACATISYTPKISLDVCPNTINKSVQFEKLIDRSPAEDRRNPFSGSSVTNDESLSSTLDLVITNEIISDFSNNGLFSKVSRKVENPDLYIRGEIRRFAGKYSLNAFGTVWLLGSTVFVFTAPLQSGNSSSVSPVAYASLFLLATPFLGIPMNKVNTDVEIELRIFDRNQNQLGTYVGHFKENINSSIYKNKQLAVPSMTNKAFSGAIGQIRNKILMDQAILK